MNFSTQSNSFGSQTPKKWRVYVNNLTDSLHPNNYSATHRVDTIMSREYSQIPESQWRFWQNGESYGWSAFTPQDAVMIKVVPQ